MTEQTPMKQSSKRRTAAREAYWLWAPVLATTTMLAILLFAPMPAVL
jgi:hypothetical protein